MSDFRRATGQSIDLSPLDPVRVRDERPGPGIGANQLGEFYNLHFIGIDSKGNVYSAEVQGKRVQKFKNIGGL